MDILPVDIDDIFNDLCGDDLEIDAYELKQILDKLIMNNRRAPKILIHPNSVRKKPKNVSSKHFPFRFVGRFWSHIIGCIPKAIDTAQIVVLFVCSSHTASGGPASRKNQ